MKAHVGTFHKDEAFSEYYKHGLQVCILQTATDIISPLLAWLLAAERQFAVRLLQSAQLALYNNYTTGHKYLNSHSEIQKTFKICNL